MSQKEVQINLQELGRATGACGYALKGLKVITQKVQTLNAPDKQRKQVVMALNDIINAIEVSGGFLFNTFQDFKKAQEPEAQPEQSEPKNPVEPMEVDNREPVQC